MSSSFFFSPSFLQLLLFVLYLFSYAFGRCSVWLLGFFVSVGCDFQVRISSCLRCRLFQQVLQVFAQLFLDVFEQLHCLLYQTSHIISWHKLSATFLFPLLNSSINPAIVWFRRIFPTCWENAPESSNSGINTTVEQRKKDIKWLKACDTFFSLANFTLVYFQSS